jgi:hypothetical protein
MSIKPDHNIVVVAIAYLCICRYKSICRSLIVSLRVMALWSAQQLAGSVCALRGFICPVVRDAIKVRYAFVNVSNSLVIFVIRSRDQMNSYSNTLFRFLFFFFSSGCCVHRYHHTDLLESLFSSLFDFLFAFFSSWHLFLYIVGYRSVPGYLLIYDAHWFTLDHVVSPSCPWKAPTASSVGCNQHEQKRNALFPTPSLLYRSDERWSADVFFIICQDTLYSFSSRFLMLVYSSYSYFAISFF